MQFLCCLCVCVHPCAQSPILEKAASAQARHTEREREREQTQRTLPLTQILMRRAAQRPCFIFNAKDCNDAPALVGIQYTHTHAHTVISIYTHIYVYVLHAFDML